MTKIISILSLCTILTACAGAPISAQEPGPLGTPADTAQTACGFPAQWTIQFNRRGGFAGFDESLVLDSGGRLTVQSERPPVDVQKTISNDQVNAIANLLARACPFEMRPNDTACADCYLYKLDVQMDGQNYVLLATDVTLTEDLHPLVNELSGLLQEAGQ